MPDVDKLKEARKKAEDIIKSLETKKLKGEVPLSEYEAWKREFTNQIAKIDSQLQDKVAPKRDGEGEKPIEPRLQIPSQPEAQAVLRSLLESSSDRIIPVFDLNHGDRYPRIEEDCHLAPQETKSLLEKLSEAGVLQREFHDLYVKCVKCNSFSIRLRPSCPSCGSANIVGGRAIGHFKCGYSDFVDKFKQVDGKYICPKCKGELKAEGTDYQKPGVWFKCQSCNKFFPTPVLKQLCNTCGTLLGSEEAFLHRVYSYRLSPVLEKENVSKLLVASAVKEHMAKAGLNVESPATLLGISGEKQLFAMAINDSTAPQNKPIVVEIVNSQNMVDLSEVVSFFAKACDADASAEILVGTPAFSEEAKKVASSYGVLTVETTDRKEIPSMLIRVIESITNTNVNQVRKEINAIKSAIGEET